MAGIDDSEARRSLLRLGLRLRQDVERLRDATARLERAATVLRSAPAWEARRAGDRVQERLAARASSPCEALLAGVPPIHPSSNWQPWLDMAGSVDHAQAAADEMVGRFRSLAEAAREALPALRGMHTSESDRSADELDHWLTDTRRAEVLDHWRRWSQAIQVAHEPSAAGATAREASARALAATLELVSGHLEADAEWFEEALGDEKKSFVAAVLGRLHVPSRLFAPLMRAAVYEGNPSANRWFVHPCMRTFGARRVAEALLPYLEGGSNREKCGAASAFYWCFALNGDGSPREDLDDISRRVQRFVLAEFVRNDDVDVRRRLLPRLGLRPGSYPEDMEPVVQQAIRIARQHPDEYIRHRVEVQLGRGGALQALPPLAGRDDRRG